jgi:hypothetical protein
LIFFIFIRSPPHTLTHYPHTHTRDSAVAVAAVALGSKAAGLAKSGGLLSKLGLLGAGAATWVATATGTKQQQQPPAAAAAPTAR